MLRVAADSLCCHENHVRLPTPVRLVSRPTGGSGNVSAPTGSREEPELEETYDRLVSEGHERLDRPLLPLVSTGLLGGVDVGIGVLIDLVVEAETDNPLLASMAFTIGFVALLLANSELFTENFLVPVISVVAKVGTLTQLVRLWVVTLAANLVAGFAMAGMIVVALPQVHEAAVKAGSHYAHLGVSWRSFFLAVLAGAVITLLTRMQHATENLGVRLVPAVLMSFVLVGAQLFHSVLDSFLMFAGLLTGNADYGYLDWLGALGWSAFGNLVGGLVLVTGIRLLRMPHRVAESREQGQTG
jgi:formate/nitrite transporter FocA (FNT family)